MQLGPRFPPSQASAWMRTFRSKMTSFTFFFKYIEIRDFTYLCGSQASSKQQGPYFVDNSRLARATYIHLYPKKNLRLGFLNKKTFLQSMSNREISKKGKFSKFKSSAHREGTKEKRWMSPKVWSGLCLSYIPNPRSFPLLLSIKEFLARNFTFSVFSKEGSIFC